LAQIVRAADRPVLTSTRDGRDRIDLVTEELFGTSEMRADLITYHPGDTAAAHYHEDATHFFFVQEGAALLHAADATVEVASGDVVMVPPGEVHWFENHGSGDFSFVELWVPAPSRTVWVSDDQCTWAPLRA
jgi:mannose-6-phosphate isomerase-like protein (cupin superfamily)